MNQILKDKIYNLGTKKIVQYLAEIGGMNDEESMLFNLLHKGETDMGIQIEMGVDKKSFARIEESVRAKLTIAIFHCIDYTMENEKD